MAEEYSRRTVLEALGGTAILAGTGVQTATAQASEGTGWPQLGRDGAKTGYNPNARGLLPSAESEVTALWSAAVEATATLNPQPIVFDGVVYYVSGKTVLGVDSETGEQRLRFEASTRLLGPPIVFETGSLADELYVATTAGEVICVSTATGDELWRQRLDGQSIQAPLSGAGELIHVSSLAAITGIDTETQSQAWRGDIGSVASLATNGDAVWGVNAEGAVGLAPRWPTQQRDRRVITQEQQVDGKWLTTKQRPAGPQTTAVSLGTGVVYAAGRGVAAFETATGRRRWRFDREIAVPAAPSVGDGTVYFASGDDVGDSTQPQRENAGTLYAMPADPVAQQQEQLRAELATRRTRLQELIDSSDDNEDEIERVLAEVSDLEAELEEVLALEDSAIEWTFDAGAPINTKPAVTDETVFVTSEGGFVYAVDAATGTERWRHQVVDGDASLTNPVVVGGQLYVGSEQGVIALGIEAPDTQTGSDEPDQSNGTSGSERGDNEQSSSGASEDETETGDSTGDDGGSSQSSDGSGPGFGLPAGLAALGGAGYLLGSRNVGENVQEGEQEGDADQ